MAMPSTTNSATSSSCVYFGSLKSAKNLKACPPPCGAGASMPGVCPNSGRAKNATRKKTAIAAR